MAELVVTAVVTIIVVVDDDLGIADGVVETGLGTNLKQPKGLMMFPSSSILLRVNLIQNFH